MLGTYDLPDLFLICVNHCNIATLHSFVYLVVTLLALALFVLDECFNCSNSLSKCVIPSVLHALLLNWVTALQIKILMQ